MEDHEDGSKTIWNVHLPRRLLILPPTALALGVAIGLSRGGSRARLRFLAENAHRQPTTIQGWYFYTKTRNYRIFFGATRQGAKDGLLLGAATTAYVLAEEGVAKLRCKAQEAAAPAPAWKGKAVDRSDDLEVEERTAPEGHEWFDGGVAGGALGLAISLIYRFPSPLIVRTSIMGVILGASEGGLRILQRRVGKLKEQSQKEQVPATAEDVSQDEPALLQTDAQDISTRPLARGSLR